MRSADPCSICNHGAPPLAVPHAGRLSNDSQGRGCTRHLSGLQGCHNHNRCQQGSSRSGAWTERPPWHAHRRTACTHRTHAGVLRCSRDRQGLFGKIAADLAWRCQLISRHEGGCMCFNTIVALPFPDQDLTVGRRPASSLYITGSRSIRVHPNIDAFCERRPNPRLKVDMVTDFHRTTATC